MPAFLALAAALIAATPACVLAPLWRGQRGPGARLAVFVAGAAIGLYALLGTPGRAFDPALREAPRTVDDAIARLQSELQRDPAARWLAPARRRLADQGRRWNRAMAFARAATLAPGRSDVLAEAAGAGQADPDAASTRRR